MSFGRAAAGASSRSSPGPRLKALVETFLDAWQVDAGDSARIKRRNGWVDLLLDANGKNILPDLLDDTERGYKELDRTKPPAFLLYVDQGEELYVRAEERQRRRFSEAIAQGIADPRLYMLMSMRANFLGELQKDEPLFKVHRKIDVLPLREAELREVVSRPAELLSARFETAGLADVITRRTAEDSVKDVGALPLLSYTLDDMWTQMVKGDDGVLRLPAQSFELGTESGDSDFVNALLTSVRGGRSERLDAALLSSSNGGAGGPAGRRRMARSTRPTPVRRARSRLGISTRLKSPLVWPRPTSGACTTALKSRPVKSPTIRRATPQ